MPENRLALHLSVPSGVPFYRQIVDQIADRIRSGKLKAGDRLPSVRDLAADLVVSLITTRRAYADLEGAGLIDLRQGQGTFVAEDVTRATDRQARLDAQEHLSTAIGRAQNLGFEDEEIRALVDDILKRKPRKP